MQTWSLRLFEYGSNTIVWIGFDMNIKRALGVAAGFVLARYLLTTKVTDKKDDRK